MRGVAVPCSGDKTTGCLSREVEPMEMKTPAWVGVFFLKGGVCFFCVCIWVIWGDKVSVPFIKCDGCACACVLGYVMRGHTVCVCLHKCGAHVC